MHFSLILDWNNWQIENKEEFLDEKSNISCKLIKYLKKASFLLSLFF